MFIISAFQHSMELNGLYVPLRKKIEGAPAFFNVETVGDIILWQRTFRKAKGWDEEEKVWLISPVDKVGKVCFFLLRFLTVLRRTTQINFPQFSRESCEKVVHVSDLQPVCDLFF